MQAIAIGDIARYVFVTSLVALVLTCVALSVAVWTRRNRIRVRLSSGLVMALIAVGVLSVAVVALRHAMTSHKGIVEAHDVFTIRSRSDAAATVVTTDGPVRQGDPLVKFQVPGLGSRLASLDNRIMTIREQLQAFDLQPLQLNASTVERKRRLFEELAQAQSILVDLQKSSRENHRALLDAQSQYTERLGQLDLQIGSENQVSTIAASQLAITQNALGRSQYLRQQGIEDITMSENRLTDRLSRELTLKKATSDLAVMERMKVDTEAMRASSIGFLSTMQTSLESQIADQEMAIATMRRRLDSAESEEADDLARAAEARRHAREAMLYEIGGLEAEKNALVATTTIEAPFAGTVIYSNSAPGIVSNNSLLVALAPASGFTARVRIGNDEVPSLDKASPVVFALADDNLLTRYLPGHYKATAPAPFEADQSIVTFDIQLPPELIERLTRSTDPIDVSLTWTAPLWEDPNFRHSLAFLVFALMLAAVAHRPKLRVRSAVALGAARFLLPFLWWCQPTEAIASRGQRVVESSSLVQATAPRLIGAGSAQLVRMAAPGRAKSN